MKMKLTNLPTFKLKTSDGFSLIELIVAVSIMIVITSVALFHQAQFSSDILITNMAYEVALTIRQAEVFGISSKGNSDLPSGLSTEQYRVGYGIHFEANGTDKPSSFWTFIDVPDQSGAPAPGTDTHFNYEYDAPTDSSNVYTDIVPVPPNPIELTQGEKIHKFMAHSSDGWSKVWDTTSTSKKSLDIVFVKPNPDAHITFWDTTDHFTGNDPNSPIKYDQAKIVIESGLGDKCRTVTVWVSGQVSVDPIVPNAPAGGCEIDYSAQ